MEPAKPISRIVQINLKKVVSVQKEQKANQIIQVVKAIKNKYCPDFFRSDNQKDKEIKTKRKNKKSIRLLMRQNNIFLQINIQ